MPTFLKIWKKWLKIARIIGNFQLRIIFSVFYILFFAPIGVMFRFFHDPLLMYEKRRRESMFVSWEYPEESLKEAAKPF